jgi:hypothetical protein
MMVRDRPRKALIPNTKSSFFTLAIFLNCCSSGEDVVIQEEPEDKERDDLVDDRSPNNENPFDVGQWDGDTRIYQNSQDMAEFQSEANRTRNTGHLRHPGGAGLEGISKFFF